jgi:hypothetical protein
MTAPEPTQPLTWVDLDAIRDRSRGINNAAEAYASAEDVPTLLADVYRLHSWNGLMALLDEHWPEDIFPTREDDTARDPGPRIISLLRWTIRLRAELSEARRERDDLATRLSARVVIEQTISELQDDVDRLRAENTAQAAKLEAVRKIQQQRRNSAMVTSEQLAAMRGWNDAVDAIREALNPCTCSLTDPSTWTTYGGLTEPGSTYQWEPDCPTHGDAPALDQSEEGQANG